MHGYISPEAYNPEAYNSVAKRDHWAQTTFKKSLTIYLE